MNLVSARGEGGNLVIGDQTVPMTNGHSVPDGAVTLGVRAEDIRLAETGEKADVVLTVDYVEELGAGRLVHGHLGEARLAVSLPSGGPLSDRLGLKLDRERLHLFEAATGRRL
jgi:sn-glycerol 3-phosphate transport system ATP-binding protein